MVVAEFGISSRIIALIEVFNSLELKLSSLNCTNGSSIFSMLAHTKKNMSGPILSCLKCHYLAFTKTIILVRTVGVKLFTQSCWHFTVFSSKQLVYKRPSAFNASCNIRTSPVWQICNKSTYRMHRERVEYPFSWLTIVSCGQAGLGVARRQINA